MLEVAKLQGEMEKQVGATAHALATLSLSLGADTRCSGADSPAPGLTALFRD